MFSGSQQRGPRLPCVYRPGPVLFWTGRRSACPGAVDHAARLDRGRHPWACYALRGPRSIFPGRWSWSASAWTAGPWPGPCSLGDLRQPGPAPAAPPRGRASGPPGPWPGPPPPGPPLPARISPPAPAILPPRFSPRFPAGIFPRNPCGR